MTNGLYMFLAFFLTWAAFFGYLAYLGRRQTRLIQEIERLKKMLSDDRSAGDAG